ncbi:MAG: HAD-IIA family hydrolase [Acidimicrobiia bacterium]
MSGAVVCDLDGVVYRGERAIAGSGEALEALEEAGWTILFATNNSARTPEHVVDKLRRLVGYEARTDQVVTSALVAASMIQVGPVLVVAESGVEAAVTEAGFELTEDPDLAATVVVGIDRALTYDRIARAAEAIRRGAAFIATNQDPTFPTEHGLLPGAGACVAAVETASGVTGINAGKPSDAMRRLIEERCPPGTIWMIGDRPDTDLALAAWPRWRSILVLTGVTASAEGVSPAPDAVAEDLVRAVELVIES